MKLSKALMTLALLALMLPGLIACGAKQEQTQEEDLLEASMAAMDEIESYRMQMSMIMDMSIAGESLNTTTHAQGAVINEPLAMEMQMNMDMGDMGGADVLMYLEKAEDGTDLVYMSMDGGASWTRQEGVSAESAETYNVKDNMDLYLKSAENFQKAGEETVNDIQTVRYDGFISQEAMNQVMETSGLQEQLGILELPEETMEAIYTDIGQVPISVWIDPENKLPVQYEMDMTQVMQNLMDNMLEMVSQEVEEVGDVLLEIQKVTISMNMSDFNQVESITIPQEAREAASV